MGTGPQPRGGGQDDPSVALGIGEEEGGQSTAGPAHESQRETGGSGGAALTGNQVEETAGQAVPPSPAPEGNVCNLPAEELSDGDVVVRGAQDTRGEQAGWTRTGLGAPETGANQSPEDLERRRKKRE